MESKNVVTTMSNEKPLTLKAGLSKYEFTTMNPLQSPWYTPANEFYGTTHVGLAAFGSNLSPIPILARNWTVSSDGKSIEFTIISNATWHDGVPVTADDVKFTYDLWKNKELYREGETLNLYLDSVEIKNKYTGVIHLKEPYAYYFLRTIFPTIYILPKHIWENVTVDDPTTYDGKDAMIGCGPYIFDNYDRDADTAILKANPDYFDGKPTVDIINWKHYRDIDTMLLALKKGDIDVLFDYKTPSGVKIVPLIGTDNVTVSQGSNINLRYMIFNYQKYPMNITGFRDAVSYAIDYSSLVNSIQGGYGEVPHEGLIPSAVPEYKADLPLVEYNITKAGQILDSLKFVDTDGDGMRNLPDGSKFKIRLLSNPNDADGIRIAEMMSFTMKKAGIDTEPFVPDRSTASDIIYGDKSFDMRIVAQDPYMISLSYGTVDIVALQYGTCNDLEYEQLYKNMMSSRDAAELKTSVYALQDYYAEEKPAIPLFWYRSLYPYRTDRYVGWIPVEGYGLTSYESWFSIRPAAT